MPLAAGPAVLLATIPEERFAFGFGLDATSVCWSVKQFASAGGDGGVMKMPPTGGAATTLASGQSAGAIELVLNSGNVFWADRDHSGIHSSQLAGGPSTSRSSVHAGSLAVDEDNLYWT